MSSHRPKREHRQHGGDHRTHRRRHTLNFPPQDYTDFTRTDISLIAPILLPERASIDTAKEARSAYEKRTKKSIADLPPHLHCKLPLLSSFCSLHSKLSPQPIISLFNSLREEIEDELPKTWGPLVERQQLSAQKGEMVEIVQHLAVLWLGPKVFQARFEREPRRRLMQEKPSKCCACTLVAMGSDFQTQVAMAGLFIGRINQNMWKGSKRIVWFMEWACARLPKDRKEAGERFIWEIGKKFRMTRLGAEGMKSRKNPKLELEEESELGPGTASYVFLLDRELREEKSRGPRKLIGAGSGQDGEPRTRRRRETEQDDMDCAIQLSREEEERASWWHGDDLTAQQEGLRRQWPSSLYSEDTTTGNRPESISIEKDIDGIIAMYRDKAASDTTAEMNDYYSPPDQRSDDYESDGPGPFGMTPSRIQSMLDKSFGSKWDGPPIR